ncbi:MAG: dihydroneopterin aldolase [Hyphomonadaceae bacterium]
MTPAPSTVSISLRNVQLAVQIGEHPWEQFAQNPSRIIVDLTLTFGYRDYFERCGGYVDYDPLRAYLKSLEQAPHVNKIEVFAKSIVKTCFEITPAERVRLSISKPDIFIEMDGVGLEFDVTRADFGA